MKKIVILSLILIGATSSAQDFYAKIYNAAAQSLAGKALQKGFTADSLAQRRGLNPDDPELGVDFLVNGGVELRLGTDLRLSDGLCQPHKTLAIGHLPR